MSDYGRLGTYGTPRPPAPPKGAFIIGGLLGLLVDVAILVAILVLMGWLVTLAAGVFGASIAVWEGTVLVLVVRLVLGLTR